MIQGLFGSGTIYSTLREGLRNEMLKSHQLADKVANATNRLSGSDGAPIDPAEEVNLEAALVGLVDATLRFDAETRLLREAYDRLRTAVGSRG